MSATTVVPFPSDPRSSATPEPADDTDNPVGRAVRELCELGDASENIQAELAALGVPRRVINVIVEFGVQKQPERQAEAMDGALEQVERTQGAGALERETLEARIVELVRIKQDTDHARQVARGLGLDPRALAILSQLIQANPGDGGEQAVNRLLAYARAAGIALEDVPRMSAELTAPPPSVLPRVARESATAKGFAGRELLRDVIVGLVIGVVVIGMLL